MRRHEADEGQKGRVDCENRYHDDQDIEFGSLIEAAQSVFAKSARRNFGQDRWSLDAPIGEGSASSAPLFGCRKDETTHLVCSRFCGLLSRLILSSESVYLFIISEIDGSCWTSVLR